jgi:aminoglycoside phosphotransferase (APT) family kinase protein
MPTTPTIPTTADDLTPEWLTAALAARYPGVAVAAVEVVERHELTNAHARIRVTYDEAAGAPAAMFGKVAPLDPARRDAIIASGMGVREARFYADLAPALAMRVPAAHVAATDDADRFVLLLEDLNESGCAVSDGTWGIPPDAAAGALADLAELHARYEDPAARAAAAPWATVSKPALGYAAPMLRDGIEHHRGRLTDAFVELAELYLTRHDELQALWHEGPHTLIHGDPHIGNLFIDGGRVGFLDWGIINVNTPMRDVGYFLTMAMQVEDRRAHERDLLRHYLDVRASHGASPLSFDDAWLAHRVHAAYNVPASCQVVTFPENASSRRRVFADAFLERAQASIDDLDSVDAVRRALAINR